NALLRVGKNQGTLTVGDFDLSSKKTDVKELRAKVGLVFQYPEYQLFAETVEADVAFGLKNFFPHLNEEEKAGKVAGALKAVGLDYNEIKDKSPFDLSGGQKRRVAIAGVIVTKPEILVLDEPVAGLDPEGKKELISLLHALNGSFVKTVVIVSHDMDFVAEECSKVAVFGDGKVIACGTPEAIFGDEELIKRSGLELPLVAKLYKSVGLTGRLSPSEFIKNVINAGVKR
ncbi:MAG: ATP-binding cassette domain-containing protein, partial [Clostridia bacterium]|nr:ATP-binding cassette domain-containing protein [Clostridia bacterium]